MTLARKHYKLIALAAACAALGTGVSAIASAGGATPASSTTPFATGAVKRHHHHEGQLLGRGIVTSVSGQRLTLTERTGKAVTLTIPTTARVRNNHAPATLADIKPGQLARVVMTPQRTIVIARTPQH
jgi:hypothetical protein